MTHETDSPAADHTGWRGILSFRPAAGWVAEHVREELELFATRPGESTFTPSVVVTVNPFTGSIREFSQRAQDGLAGTLGDLRMIDVGGWEPDPQPVDPDQPQGEVEDASSLRHRRLEYVHRAPNGQLVSGVDYLLLRDGWAIQVSTTCSIQERMTLSDAFHHMVDSVTTLRPADTGAPSDDATSAGDPPLDAAASAALGADVEALDQLGRATAAAPRRRLRPCQHHQRVRAPGSRRPLQPGPTHLPAEGAHRRGPRRLRAPRPAQRRTPHRRRRLLPPRDHGQPAQRPRHRLPR